MQISPLVLWFNTGLMLASLAAWGAIAGRLWRRQPLVPYEPRRPVPWRGRHLLMVIAVELVALQVCLSLGFHLSGIPYPDDFDTAGPDAQILLIACATLANLICFVAAVLIVTLRAGANAGDLGLALRPAGRDALYGAAAFVALAPILYAMQIFFFKVLQIEYDHPLIEALQAKPDAGTWWLVIGCAVVVAPVVEEFLFRVLLQGWLEKVEWMQVQGGITDDWDSADDPASDPSLLTPRSSPLTPHQSPASGWLGLPMGSGPILVSSILFALMHWGHGAAPVPLFLYGLALGFLYHRTHRLLPSLMAHLLLNAVSTLMIYLTLSP